MSFVGLVTIVSREQIRNPVRPPVQPNKPCTCLTLYVTLPVAAVSAKGPCKPINYCAKSVCKNGATCSSSPSGFSCKCLAGYTGTRCQHNKNECASSPCVHGSCVDGLNGYSCVCFEGYVGKCPTLSCNMQQYWISILLPVIILYYNSI